MRMVVPAPRRLSIATRPPSFSVFSRTIASPRPRPDTWVMMGLVETSASNTSASAADSPSEPEASGARSPRLIGGRLDLFEVDAGPIVADRDFDFVAVDRRHGDSDRGLRRFAGAPPLLGRLDAMIDAIAQQVNERILQLLEDALVDRDFLAADREDRLFALVAAQVPNDLEQQGTDRGQRQHEQLLRVFQQLIDQLCHQQAILVRAAAQSGHTAFEGSNVVVIPVEELRQIMRIRRRDTVRGLLATLPQPAHPRLNSAPLLAPLLEAGFQRCEIRRPLVRGEFRRQHFFRLQQTCVEGAHGNANGFGLPCRGGNDLLPRDRLFSPRAVIGSGFDPTGGIFRGLGHHPPRRIQGAVRIVERFRRRRAFAALPRGEQSFQRLAQSFDLAEVDRARGALEAMRGSKIVSISRVRSAAAAAFSNSMRPVPIVCRCSAASTLKVARRARSSSSSTPLMGASHRKPASSASPSDLVGVGQLLQTLAKLVDIARRVLQLPGARHVLGTRHLDVFHRDGHLIHSDQLLLARGGNLRCSLRRLIHARRQRADRFPRGFRLSRAGLTALPPCSVAIAAAVVAFWISPRMVRTLSVA